MSGRISMNKYISAIIFLVILLLQIILAIIPSVTVAEAAGNVTINDFSINVSKGQFPLSTRLTANVTGNVTNYLWEFYNPNFNISSYSTENHSTFHRFGNAGVAYGFFNVTLDVWGPDGNDHLKKIDYVVTNKNTTGLPNASFVASATSGDAPLNVTFTDNSTNVTARLWYFGFKGTSTEKDPTFNFTSPGDYRVVLEVSNNRGFDATAQDIIVSGKQQVAILPEADFDADTSNYLTVQFSDLSQNGKAFNWSFGDGTNSSEFSPAHTYAKAGDYTVHLTASNENGTNTTSKMISVNESSSSGGSDNSGSDNSGSGGGGSSYGSATIEGSSSSGSSSGGSGAGGAGVSPENQSNVATKELSQEFIGSGTSVNFNFPQAVTPVLNISFYSKTTVGKTTTIVEMLIDQSTLVSEPPADEVYKFINIWAGNGGVVTPDNIENAVVNFKVDKSWIQDKNIEKSSIILNRYNDTKWNALPTNLSGEDDKYLYFTAETPGFSPFAITGKITANEAVNATSSENQTGPNIGSLENNASNATSTEQTPAQTQSPSKKSPGFEAVYGIIGLLALYLYNRK
jgi:PGF-pre-PGF domain-containing protein